VKMCMAILDSNSGHPFGGHCVCTAGWVQFWRGVSLMLLYGIDKILFQYLWFTRRFTVAKLFVFYTVYYINYQNIVSEEKCKVYYINQNIVSEEK
jgi:hypothetical protein